MIINERNPSYDEYKALRVAVGWDVTEVESTKTALSNALYTLVALDGDDVIGIGRVIGDGGLYYYIQDLIVHPHYQNKGIGKKLMSKLMGFIKSHAQTGSFVGLTAAPGLENYYNNFGFMSREEDGKGMNIHIK